MSFLNSLIQSYLTITMAKQNEKYLLIARYWRTESSDMHIIDDILAIIYAYHTFAGWSNQYKGTGIELSIDNGYFKAENTIDYGHSVRGECAIQRGVITCWELECRKSTFPDIYGPDDGIHFYGVVSSKIQDFNTCPEHGMKGCYGTKSSDEVIWWTKPCFPKFEVFKIKMIADWTEKRCKLSIYYQGKKFNEFNQDYTMLLPKLDDNHVWYPCVSPNGIGSYCIIRYL